MPYFNVLVVEGILFISCNVLAGILYDRPVLVVDLRAAEESSLDRLDTILLIATLASLVVTR